VSKAEQAAYERERERQRAENDNKRRAKLERLRMQESEVMMGEANRGLVERVLREFFKSRGLPDGGLPAASSKGSVAVEEPADRDTAVASLVSLGFAMQYVTSALDAVGSDQDQALDWLCRHVPEAELPPYADKCTWIVLLRLSAHFLRVPCVDLLTVRCMIMCLVVHQDV
jgi:hypothetical protein